MPGAEAAYPAPESFDRQIDWSLWPFNFHCQEIPTPSYDTQNLAILESQIWVCFIMNHISSKILSRKVMFEAKKLFSQTAMGKHLWKQRTTKGAILWLFEWAKQLMAGAPEEKKSPPAPYPKKHWWEQGVDSPKNHGQSQQFQPKNPKTKPEISCSNKRDKLFFFQQNKRQMPPVVHLVQHGRKCSKVLRCDSMTRQCPVLEHVFLNSNEDEICRVFSRKRHPTPRPHSLSLQPKPWLEQPPPHQNCQTSSCFLDFALS